MSWKEYSFAFLLFSGVSFVALFLLQLLQGHLPLNPRNFGAVRWDTALNTAISFMTNTNWQAYSGETTMSYLTQMLGLTVQNFVSAAAGIAVLLPLIRGFTSRLKDTVGNFWVDMTRSVLYILLPLSIILSLALVSQGAVQTLGDYVKAAPLEGGEQVIAVGPAASQVAVKQLGSNGGGFFNANSAHPFENPNDVTNFLELLAILLIPAALPLAMGRMLGQQAAGLGHLRRNGGPLRDRPHPFLRCRMADEPHARKTGRYGQHGREGGPLRHRPVGPLGPVYHCHFERLREHRCTTA